MGLIEGINRLIGLIVDTLRQVGRVRIWLWLFGYFLLTWLILYAHYDFTSPLFYGPVTAWTNLLDSQQATGFTHYEGHFLLLPYFFEYARLLFSVLFESLVLGAVAVLFYESFVRVDDDDRFSLRSLVRSWIHLALVVAVINGVTLGVGRLLPELLAPVLAYSPRRIQLFQWVVMPGIYAVILALFFYAVSAVAVYRDTVIGAIGRSLRVFFRNPVTSLVMAVLVLAGPIIISNLTANPQIIVGRFSPELVYWLLLFGLLINMIVNFFWIGLSVRVLVDEEQ